MDPGALLVLTQLAVAAPGPVVAVDLDLRVLPEVMQAAVKRGLGAGAPVRELSDSDRKQLGVAGPCSRVPLRCLQRARARLAAAGALTAVASAEGPNLRVWYHGERQLYGPERISLYGLGPAEAEAEVARALRELAGADWPALAAGDPLDPDLIPLPDPALDPLGEPALVPLDPPAAAPVVAPRAEAPKPAPPAASSAEGTEREPVLIMPLGFEGVEPAVARQVEEALLVALGRLARLKIVSQAEMALVLERAEKQRLLGCAEGATECFAELHRLGSVRQVVGGRVGRLADTFVVNLSLTNAERATVLARASEVAYDEPGLLEAAARAGLALFGEATEQGPRFHLADSGMRSIALIDLTPTGLPAEVAGNLTQVMAVRLKQIEGLSVLTLDDLKAILDMEQQRRLLGCEDNVACMAEIGGAMGADGIIAGHVGKLADTFVIGLKLINPREVKVQNRLTESFQGDVNQLIRAARYGITELLGLSHEGEGQLEIKAEASEGTVYIGEQPFALDGFAARLDEGKYLLRIEADDYFPWSSDVYVERGDKTRLNAALLARPLAWYEQWWFWGAAGAVVLGAGTAVALIAASQSDPTESPGDAGVIE